MGALLVEDIDHDERVPDFICARHRPVDTDRNGVDEVSLVLLRWAGVLGSRRT